MRRAFGLVEVIVALCVLVLALVPVMTVFSTAGRQARQTADLGHVLALAEKVAEDLRIGSWENVYWLADIEADPSFVSSSPILDGENRFFAAVEDTAPPFGRLRADDTGISRDMRPLYDQVKSYRLEVRSRGRQLPTTGRVTDFDIEFEWDGHNGQRLSLTLPLVIGHYDVVPSPPDIVADRPRADQLVARLFYPRDRGRTLEQSALARGARPDVVREVGDALIVVLATQRSDPAYRAEIRRLTGERDAGPSPSVRAQAQLGIARTWEARAAELLHALWFVSERTDRVGALVDGGALGDLGDRADDVELAIDELGALASRFRGALEAARREYRAALSSPEAAALEPRVRMRATQKLIEVLKLQVVSGRIASLPELREVADRMRSEYEGRNPHVHRLAVRELRAAASREQVLAAYRATWRKESQDRYERSAPLLIKKISRRRRRGS